MDQTTTQPPPTQTRGTDELAGELDRILDELASATDETRRPLQNELFDVAGELLAGREGLAVLNKRADRFDEVGVFVGGPWADPSDLQVPLVAGTLRGPGVTPIAESLSELRMLALATGRVRSEHMTSEEAAQFLGEVLA